MYKGSSPLSFMEELRRDQEANDERAAEYEKRRMELRSQINDTEEKDEEDWEEEYVVLDLDDVFHGAPIPNFAYTLSGLDTSNPILTLDNGLKLIGQYMETVGSVVVYSEKERDVVAETSADPFAGNTVRKPLKRIRGVCKLERKLKFCAMPLDSAPPNHTVFTHSAPAQNAGNASLANVMLVPHVNERPAEDGLHVNNRSMEEDALHVSNRPVEEDALLVNNRPVEEDALHLHNRPVEEDVMHVNDRPMEEDALHLSDRPVEEDALHVNNRPVEEDVLHGNDTPVEDSLIQNT